MPQRYDNPFDIWSVEFETSGRVLIEKANEPLFGSGKNHGADDLSREAAIAAIVRPARRVDAYAQLGLQSTKSFTESPARAEP